MPEPIIVDVDSEAEAVDLSRALAVRGFAARPVSVGERQEVELSSRHERPDRLLADLLPALEAWRLDRGHAPLRVSVGAEVRVVGQLESVERPRRAAAAAAA